MQTGWSNDFSSPQKTELLVSKISKYEVSNIFLPLNKEKPQFVNYNFKSL